MLSILESGIYRSDALAAERLRTFGSKHYLRDDLNHYAISHGAFHLIKAGEFERALSLLGSVGYIHSRLAFGQWGCVVNDCVGLVEEARDENWELMKDAELLLDAALLVRNSIRQGFGSIDEQYWQRLHNVVGSETTHILAADARARARATCHMTARQPFLKPAGGVLRAKLNCPEFIHLSPSRSRGCYVSSASRSNDHAILLWDVAAGGEPLLALKATTTSILYILRFRQSSNCRWVR